MTSDETKRRLYRSLRDRRATEILRKAGITPEVLRTKSRREIARLHLRAEEQATRELGGRPLDWAIDEEDRVAREQDRLIARVLRERGVQVSSVWDMIDGPTPPEAIPVLLSFLPLNLNPIVKEGIVRNLIAKEARGAAAMPLIEEFKKCESPTLKWVIGDALATVADSSVFTQLAELALDSRHGNARQRLADALVRTKDPRADDVLISMLEDRGLIRHAIHALSLRRSKMAIPYLERLLSDDEPWIQDLARKAIVRIDKTSARHSKTRKGATNRARS